MIVDGMSGFRYANTVNKLQQKTMQQKLVVNSIRIWIMNQRINRSAIKSELRIAHKIWEFRILSHRHEIFTIFTQIVSARVVWAPAFILSCILFISMKSSGWSSTLQRMEVVCSWCDVCSCQQHFIIAPLHHRLLHGHRIHHTPPPPSISEIVKIC